MYFIINNFRYMHRDTLQNICTGPISNASFVRLSISVKDLTGGKLVPVEGVSSPLYALEINPDKSMEEFRTAGQKLGGGGAKSLMQSMRLGAIADQILLRTWNWCAMVTMVVCSIFRRASKPTSAYDVPPEADVAWRLILMIGSVPAALTYYWRMMMPETAR
ncbi:ATPase GET3B [Trifolium repens]|nr:ATPase GET3B [Trifolium repens]